jgi:PIN domain nuclease of toxin-antitoxin system
MRLLLDTHAVAWWFEDSSRLGRAAYAAISDGDNLILVSAVSIFEMTLMHRLGKWPEIADLLGDLDGYLRNQRFETLPLTPQHAEIAGNLDIPYRDPFDRMLIAQAQVEGAQFVSNEMLFDGFDVNRLW